METRKLNTVDIIGMDLRDYSIDQQHAKEIINLKREKDGWKIRDSSLSFLTGLTDSDVISEIFEYDSDKILYHKNNYLYLYGVTNDVISSFYELYNIGFSFKMWNTSYPKAYILVDTTNHKNYILEFSDRIMLLNNDTGDLNQSTEFLLHEYDVNTQDLLWYSMCKHDTIAENSKNWTNSLDKYCLYYDYNSGINSRIVLLNQINLTYNINRIITVAQNGTTGILTLFEYNNNKPEIYEKKTELTSTTLIGTNNQQLYIDVDSIKQSKSAELQDSNSSRIAVNYHNNLWIAGSGGVFEVINGEYQTRTNLSVAGFKDCFYVFNDTLYLGTEGAAGANYVSYWNGSSWIDMSTGITGRVYSITEWNNVLYCTGIDIGVMYWNGSTWVAINTGLTGSSLDGYIIIVFNNTLWIGTSAGIYSYNGTSWDDKTTGYSANPYIFSMCIWEGSLYSCSFNGGGVRKWNNTTSNWDNFSTGLSGTSLNCYSLVIYEGTLWMGNAAVGLKKYETSTWVDKSSGLTGSALNLFSIYVYNNELYLPTTNGTYKLKETIETSNIYLNAITSVPIITMNDFANTYTYGTHITAGLSDCKAVKAMYYEDPLDSTKKIKYVIAMDGQQIKVYLTSKSGTLTDIENGTVSLTTPLISVTTKYYSNFHSMHLCRNNVFNLLTTSRMDEYDLYIYYDYYIHLVSFVIYWDTSHVLSTHTLQCSTSTSVGESIGYDLLNTNNDQCFMWGKSNASILTNGLTHNLYINKDKTIIKIPVSGIVMTATDVLNIETIYNSEISDKLDPDGNVLGGIETTPAGYSLTEINLSKPLAVRPYFTPDTGDTIYDTTVAVENQSDDNEAFEDWNIAGATLANSDNFKLYWNYVVSVNTGNGTGTVNVCNTAKILDGNGTSFLTELTPNVVITIADGVGAFIVNVITNNTFATLRSATGKNSNGTAFTISNNVHTTNLYSHAEKSSGYEVLGGKWNVPNSCSMVVSFDVKNLSQYTTNYCNVVITTGTLGNSDDTDDANILQIGIPDAEFFNMYEMVTPLSGGGTANFRTPIEVGSGSFIRFSSDDYTTFHKYWIFGLLKSGLMDKDIPYILVAKGEYLPGTDNYQLTYWKQDEYSDLIKNEAHLPHWFSNSETNDNSMTAGLATDTDKIYIVNDKIFYKQGDTYRDKFNSYSYWQQNKNVLFESQDVAIVGDLIYHINYEKKKAYYGLGYKYINLFNELSLKSKPTAIQTIDQVNGILACENNIYYVTGTDEYNVILTEVISNVGLEKDNWRSLITNGNKAFFYNKKGIWMVDNGQVINISEPLTDRIYRVSTGNVLGYDYAQNCLLIPLDYTKFLAHKVQLMAGDYGTTAQTIEYDNIMALFNVQEASYRLYSFIDDSTVAPTKFMGNYKEHPIVRVGTKLIIPEYSESIGTENPLCRFWTKRMTFGDDNELKKLDSFWATLYNQTNIAATIYGIDYFKLYMIIDNSTVWSKKYGDFKGTGYSDATVGKMMSPDSATTGFRTINFRFPNIDFHNIQIVFEFSRLKDTNITNASLSYIILDIINKAIKSRGVR